MCGIIGRWNQNSIIQTDEFRRARDSMKHRGPDGRGEYFTDDGNIALGHRRLSFMDLSRAGRQPMSNEDGSIWITVNGEIYNYRELKSQLEAKGHIFKSGCDSEILIHAYEEWGCDCIAKLKGMFAFGLYDSKKKQMLVARDRFGIKPLYYLHDKEKFIFASELKAITSFEDVKSELDFTSFGDFFVYRYIPSPKTIWQGIHKLPAAHFILFSENRPPEIKQYWELSPQDRICDERKVIEKIDHFLEESVKGHLMSDVPVGSFLSGGYDSSALVYYCRRNAYTPKTFSIGFENWNGSEHQFAETVSGIFGTDHTSKIVNDSDLDLVDTLVFNYDEPIADISIIPTYIVSKLAAEKVKAVLSGEGADEIFAGYTWHRPPLPPKYTLAWLQQMAGSILKKNGFYGVDEYSDAMAMGKFDRLMLQELLNPDLHECINQDTNWYYRQHHNPAISPIKRFQYMDVNTFMSELVLTKIDRASMANSLEVRVPFLDHELVEYMFSVSEKTYFKPKYQKYILFNNIKNALPQEILNRQKQGFVGPGKYYENFEWYKAIFKSSNLIDDQIIKATTIDNWLNNHDHWRLWKAAVMEKWYTHWCK